MDREEKNRLADSKMQEMRRKNAELMKRYEEIEADKKNAHVVSKLAALKMNKSDEENSSDEESATNTKIRDENDTLVKNVDLGPKAIKEKAHRTARNSSDNKKTEDTTPKALNSPPPPDPKFNFLADSARFESTNEKSLNCRPLQRFPRQEKTHSDNQEKSWDSPVKENTSRQGFKSQNTKTVGSSSGYFGHSRPAAPSDQWGRQNAAMPVPSTQRQTEGCLTGKELEGYQAWLVERRTVDTDRLARQQTTPGKWRREWDADKRFENDADFSEPKNSFEDGCNAGGRWFNNSSGRFTDNRPGQVQRSDGPQNAPSQNFGRTERQVPPTPSRRHPLADENAAGEVTVLKNAPSFASHSTHAECQISSAPPVPFSNIATFQRPTAEESQSAASEKTSENCETAPIGQFLQSTQPKVSVTHQTADNGQGLVVSVDQSKISSEMAGHTKRAVEIVADQSKENVADDDDDDQWEDFDDCNAGEIVCETGFHNAVEIAGLRDSGQANFLRENVGESDENLTVVSAKVGTDEFIEKIQQQPLNGFTNAEKSIDAINDFVELIVDRVLSEIISHI